MTIGFFGEPSRPIVEAMRHADEHVRGLDVAAGKRVANGRPVRAFGDRGVDAVLFEEAFLVRDDDRRAIGQRDHAEAQVGHLGRVGSEIGCGPALGQVTEE